MANFARIINNIAIDVSDDPDNHFHPDIASEFVEVPDEVSHGWKLLDDEWVAPDEVVPPTLPNAVVSPIVFKLLFTSNERIAAKTLRNTDPIIDDFWSILDDPRTDIVDMRLQSIQDIIGYTLNAINPATVSIRKAEIFTGVIK